MKPLPKWFLIPPAAAALVVLSSLTQGSEARPRASSPAAAAPVEPQAAAEAPAPAGRREVPTGPKAPDFGQMLAALVAVLGLGVAGVYVLRQVRGPARPSGDGRLLTLRQSLRLSPRHTLHAIEFDERIVLVGETERGLALVDGGRLPDRAADEAAVLARTAATAAGNDDADDDGAVPKDLIIPRPERPLPTRPARMPAPKPAAAPAPALADFRNLLQKAGRS